MNRKDTLAILPTGGGKSLCYQIPSLMLDGLTIVISPLISLMQDQVAQVKSKIPAEYLNSLQNFQEQSKVQNKLLNNGIKLLYISPEKLITQNFIELLSKIKISLVAIDEAHCISEWGHDFRPSYLKIKDALSNIPRIPIAAFTATATPEVQVDIIEKLELIEPAVFVKGFSRDNIKIKIFKPQNRSKKIIELLKSIKGSMIVYCQSRREVDELNQKLVSENLSSLPYHAGMSAEERKLVQDYFLNNKAEIIVATNAFGMGINKKDIRMVIHQGMPGSIENYYQEIGRAGRDGKPSEACLVYNRNDRKIHEYFIKNSLPTRELIHEFYNKIHNYSGVKIGEVNQNKISTSLNFLKKVLKQDLSKSLLNSILNVLEHYDLIKYALNDKNYFFIKLLLTAGEVKQIENSLSVNEQNFLEWILRNHGSKAYSSFVRINFQKILDELFLYKTEIEDINRSLETRGIIEFKLPVSDEEFYFVGERVYAERLPINYARLEERAIHNFKKLELMENLVHLKDCRWKFILNYFNEKTDEDYKCNNCDNCTNKDGAIDLIHIDLEREILKTVKEVRGKFGANMIVDVLRGAKTKKIANFHLHEISTFGFCSGISKEKIKETINSLLAENKLNKTASLYPTIFLTEEGEKIVEGENVQPKVIPTPIKPSKIDLKVNLSLYERLRDVRNLLAKRFNQPNFMICSDEILREASIQMPQTKNDFFKIKGIGEKVFLKCGDAIIQEVNSFLYEQSKFDETEKEKMLPQNIRTTLNMIREGNTLVEICEKRNLSDTVISEHIQTLIENSFEIDIGKLIPLKNIELIKEALQKTESNFLPVVKSHLPDEITFAEIRICMSYFKKAAKD